MRSYLYPTFTMESEDFEKALPLAIKFSQTHEVACRVIKEGELYGLCFEDKAIAKGIVYGHQYEKELDKKFSKYSICEIIYLKKADFEKGISCTASQN